MEAMMELANRLADHIEKTYGHRFMIGITDDRLIIYTHTRKQMIEYIKLFPSFEGVMIQVEHMGKPKPAEAI